MTPAGPHVTSSEVEDHLNAPAAPREAPPNIQLASLAESGIIPGMLRPAALLGVLALTGSLAQTPATMSDVPSE